MTKHDQLLAEHRALQDRLMRVEDALRPPVGAFDDYGAAIERMERHIFNEARLRDALGRGDGQAVMVIWCRYKDALAALGGDGELDEAL